MSSNRAASINCVLFAFFSCFLFFGSLLASAAAAAAQLIIDQNEDNHLVKIEPGLSLILHQRALDELKDQAITRLHQSLLPASTPDVTETLDTPVGQIELSLLNLTIDNLTTPNTKAHISSEGIEIACHDATVHVISDWTYKKVSWPHISDSGKAEISLNIDSLIASFIVNLDEDGIPLTEPDSISVKIGNADVKLSGGASWLYQLFINSIVKGLLPSIESTISDALKTNIPEIATGYMRSVPLVVPVIPGTLEVSYEFISRPIFSPLSMITSNHIGRFRRTKKPMDSEAILEEIKPEQSVPFRTPMLEIILPEVFANSALQTLRDLHLLDFQVSHDQLPSSFPIDLNTKEFCDVIPGIDCKKYPNSNMLASLKPKSVPKAKYSSSGVTITSDVILDLSIISHSKQTSIYNSTLTTIFESTIDLSPTRTAFVGEIQTANVTLNSYWTTTPSSSSFLQEKLSVLIEALFKQILTPRFNAVLQRGVNFPSLPETRISSYQISLEEPSSIVFACDVEIFSSAA